MNILPEIMNNGNFAEWRDKIVFWGMTAIVTWLSFITIQVFSNPYLEDRKLIEEQIMQISGVIERNTQAINQLKLEISRTRNQEAVKNEHSKKALPFGRNGGNDDSDTVHEFVHGPDD